MPARGSLVLLMAAFVFVVPSVPPSVAQTRETAVRAARAKEAMQARRFTEAAALYAELVRELPSQPGLRLNLGIALYSAGRYADAATELERVVSEQDDLTPAWLMLGVSRLKLGKPGLAVPALQRVIAREPRQSIARLELGNAHLMLGQFDRAAREFVALTDLEPRQPNGWLGLARSYAGIARAAFEELERSWPQSAEWAALLARSRATQQQYRSAFQLYRQALARDPRLRGVHSAIAEIYRRTGNPAWAAEEERREAALPPLDCERERPACDFAAGQYGEMLDRLGADGTAQKLYWRSLAASELAQTAHARIEALPASPELHTLRAEAYRIRGLHGPSIGEWQAALKLAPNDPELLRQLAESYRLNQDHDKALPILQELRGRGHDSADLAFQLGDTLRQLQRAEEAIPVLEGAVRKQPDHAASRLSLARALIRDARSEDAIPHLEAALQADDDGSIHVLLARAYAAAGRQAESVRAMERAEALRAADAQRKALARDAGITPPD